MIDIDWLKAILQEEISDTHLSIKDNKRSGISYDYELGIINGLERALSMIELATDRKCKQITEYATTQNQ